MFKSYWDNRANSQGSSGFNIIADLLVILLSLPGLIVNFTINKPKLSLVLYYIFGLVGIGFIGGDWTGFTIYVVFVTAFAYCAYRWLGGWRRGILIIRSVRDNLESFYDDVSTRRNIKMVKTNIPGSYRIDFVTPYHKSDEQLMKQIPMVASSLQVVKYSPMDLDDREGFVTILFSDVDPLEQHLDGASAPVLHMTEDERQDPYFWLPIGVNALGEPAEIPTFTREGANRDLTQGDSGAGKNSIIRQRVLQNTLNPHVDVFICDGKGGSEFAPFKDYVQHYATDKKSFFEQLRLLEAEVARRSEILSHNIRTQPNRWTEAWNIYDDGNLLYWAWDELGRIKGQMSPKEEMEVDARIFGITSVGRSLGIAASFVSQTFRNDILDTKTRDNTFNIGIGFKSSDIRESTYIGFSADDDVAPHLIKGKLLKSGRTSTVGQFALRGTGRNWYGKSYYITNQQCIDALRQIEPNETEDELEALPV
jgi:hypothetical protein